MVTTCTYRPSLVKIDAPQLASAQCNNKKQQQKATKRTRPNYLPPPRELYVFIGVCLFVSRINAKTTRTIFTKFGGKAAHGPWKNPLDTGGNPDHAPAGRRRKLCLYQVTGKSLTIILLNRFDTTLQGCRHWTDRQTDRQAEILYQYRASHWRAVKCFVLE